MNDFTSALKSEISRLARKELRAHLEPIKKSATQSKAQLAALREEVRTLKAQLRVQNRQSKRPDESANSDHEMGTRQRFTAKGFATMRNRLGLSYAEMGLLLGASDQSVRKWEDGAAVPRSKYQHAIFALRGVGKRAIAKHLANTSHTKH